MNPEDSSLPPRDPPSLPFALPYASLTPSRPGLITVISVIGIIIAVLGLVVAAFGTLSLVATAFMGSAMPAMRQTPGATAVTVCDSVVGAALAATLLTGSIGLLRLRSWSRRVLTWWGWTYLLSLVVFLLLQIQIVVPSQLVMLTNMMATMSPALPPAPSAPGAAAPTTSTSFSFTVTAGNGATTTTTTGFPFVRGGPMPAQTMAMMRLGYISMAIGKDVICLIFPIVVLAVMQMKTVRSALAPNPQQMASVDRTGRIE
jgi:hypothetical protein